MMLPVTNGHNGYLDDLDRIQSALDTVQRQISSGVRVGMASDDPGAVPPILNGQIAIAMDEQIQANLNDVKAELESGDSALQQAGKLMDQAISVAAHGANGATTPTEYQMLLQQALGIQQAIFGIASTSVNGRYIFSGDRDDRPLYIADANQANGVLQIAPATSTVRITDRNGVEVWRRRTAAEIFDFGDASGGNVFAAISGLVAALRGQDAGQAEDAAANLKNAADHLNQQLGLYGIGETRVDDSLNASSKAVISEKQDLGKRRDTDVAGAAIQLSQMTIRQQAALSVGARISQRSLFDYLA